ncbi:MAG: hypothetical protein A2511_17535 [Deltaproteobacteria bacterium RIFOXYD12_FULL_50_9]|nr:MAG: hypothetical protein A2511_17535 [Deltaproteobacteria bacterium RIFOXYD12_FULL_50_9]
MDIKQIFKNYDQDGNNYILKADAKNRWCGFNKNTIDKLYNKYNANFNIVIWGTKSDSDYYCIPYKSIEHLFTPEHMTKGKLAEQGNKRWGVTIDNHVFKMHSNSKYSVNIEKFYGKHESVIIEDYEEIREHFAAFQAKVESSLQDSGAKRRVRLQAAATRPARVLALTHVYARNPDVVAEVLVRATGVCEVCRKPAPFRRAKDSSPYLEVHHKIQLADNGEDTVENAIAVCPNCHRQAHFGED